MLASIVLHVGYSVLVNCGVYLSSCVKMITAGRWYSNCESVCPCVLSVGCSVNIRWPIQYKIQYQQYTEDIFVTV